MKKYILLFLFIFLLINFGCDSTTEPIKEKSLKGIVKDAQGNLLSDVKVFIIYDCGQIPAKIQSNNAFNKPTSIDVAVLYSFTGSSYEDGVRLDWTTLVELNNSGFQVERKTSTSDWIVIGFVTGAGSTNDTSYYSFNDINLESGDYWYRLKAIEFDGSFEYSNSISVSTLSPSQTNIEQNYPNPFDLSTTIRSQLRKQANVKMDVCSFYDKSTLKNLIDQQLNAGNYSLILQPDSLPTNAYKVLIKIQESDSIYTLEKNIFKAYLFYDQAILNSCPNSITNSGSFEIKYDDIPFGQKFYRTGEADPSPLGEFMLKNNLKLVIYKSGYKVIQKDVVIDLNEGQEIQITLEAE